MWCKIEVITDPNSKLELAARKSDNNYRYFRVRHPSSKELYIVQLNLPQGVPFLIYQASLKWFFLVFENTLSAKKKKHKTYSPKTG